MTRDHDAGRPRAVRLAVVGAHLAGQPLNHQLTGRGAHLVAATRTAPAGAGGQPSGRAATLQG